jgi:transposase
MKLHGNAALSWSGRRRLVDRVIVEEWTLTAAAEAAGVSVRCARKWVGRYRLEGVRGLQDRSSAPRRVANRTPAERIDVIVALRRLRMTAAEIAELVGMALSTVSGILTRLGLGRLGRIGLELPVRYERSRPGELVHIDVKKLGRVRGVGHRISGSRASQGKTRIAGRRRGIAGWEYVHIAVDVECPRFRGQLSAGLSGPAERLSGYAKEAEVPKAVSAGVSAGGGSALRSH